MDVPGRRVLYLSSSPAGAVAEVFAPLATWTPTMFASPARPAARRALGRYELPSDASVLDLDDATVLRDLGLRPSAVVSMDRAVTQDWARTIAAQRRWAGVRWWSRYDSRWHSYGLWDSGQLKVTGVEQLSLEHPAVIEAAAVLRPARG